MFDNARAKVRKVERPSIWIRGRLGRFEDSVNSKPGPKTKLRLKVLLSNLHSLANKANPLIQELNQFLS